MKKLLAIVLALIMLLSLCACGGKSNDNGKKAPQLSLENLTGTFKYDNGHGFELYYLTFKADGSFSAKVTGAAGSISNEGKFTINDGKITISDFGKYVSCCPFGDGEYAISLDGTTLTINNIQWVYQK